LQVELLQQVLGRVAPGVAEDSLLDLLEIRRSGPDAFNRLRELRPLLGA
jgi:hypothetical protein